MADFLPSELIINPKGEIYHLAIAPDDIAHKIIIVGDQDRVKLVSGFFDTITHRSQHREFASHTGFYNGKKITVISTGIGTDNIDIVINELDALVNVDFQNRKEKEQKTSLEIVRIGTCGILQDDIHLDSFILSDYSLGIDNVGHFYQITSDETTKQLENEIISQVQLPKLVHPYLVKATEELNNKLLSDKVVKGITVTSSGFYGPQGRQLRLPLTIKNMVSSFTDFKFRDKRIVNLEMETSALFALATALGHQATGICLGIANRRKKEVSENYSIKIIELIKYVLDRI